MYLFIVQKLLLIFIFRQNVLFFKLLPLIIPTIACKICLSFIVIVGTPVRIRNVVNFSCTEREHLNAQ